MPDSRQFNGTSFTPVEFAALGGSLREAFLSTCAKFPNERALTCFHAQTSRDIRYQELRADVGQVMLQLDRVAYDKNTVVTLAGNHYEHVVTILAILFSGRRLCPISPNEPSAQIKRRLSLFTQPFLIIEREIPELSGIAMQSLFAAASPADGFPAPRFTRGLDDDAIYVFSSGSTGESKIIRQTEGMLLTNVEALIRHHGLREKRKVIATPLPLFHVNALEFALFTSLLAGGELILFEHFDPDKLLTILQTRKIAIASLIPPMLRLLIERSKKGNFSFENLGYAVSAATALPKTVAKDFTERTGKRILQGYGLSEAVNFSCLTPTNLSDESYAKLMFDEKYCTIGTALWGNEVEILNSDGKPCPEREAGEIAIRGWNVMPGYLGDQDPRAQFRHGYLHTGDLGYWIELGGKKYYFISGRTKDCIKRAGETIPLRDIDDFVAGLRIAGLDAIAVPYPHVLMGEDFGLLCRPSQSSPADWQDALTLAFKNGFSQAMRPKSYQVTEEMIRTESGKPLRWKFSARFAP